MSANKNCVTRLQREYKALLKDPVPNVTAHPLPQDLLEWHYVLEGSTGTEYEGGVFHGKIIFPPQYPYKPPSILMLTPNGRFATGTKLCLSMTDYHPESWNPMWSVGTILAGLLSFMSDNQPTTGSICCSLEMRREYAQASLAFNVKNSTFRKLFPNWVEEQKLRETRVEKKEAVDEKVEPEVPEEVQGTQVVKEPEQPQVAVQGVGSYGTVFSLLAVVVVIAGLLAVPLMSTDFAV